MAWKTLRGLLPWLATGLIFYYIFRQVPFSQVWSALKLVRLQILIPVVLINYIAYFLADVWVHYLAFKWLAAEVRFREVLFARGASYILGLINFFIGQGGVGYWLARAKHVPAGEATSTIFFIMFMDLFLLILLSATGVLFFLPEVRLTDFFTLRPEGDLVRFTLITLAVLLSQIWIWIRKPKAPLVRWLLFRGPFLVFDRLQPRHFGLIFLLKLFIYGFDIFANWLGLKALGVEVSLTHILTYLPLIYLIGSIPITVLHLGTTQAAWLWFFQDLAPPAAVLAFTLLWSFCFIVLRGLTGLACLPRVYQDLVAPRN